MRHLTGPAILLLAGCGHDVADCVRAQPRPGVVVHVERPMPHMDNDYTGYCVVEVGGHRYRSETVWGEPGEEFNIRPSQVTDVPQHINGLFSVPHSIWPKSD